MSTVLTSTCRKSKQSGEAGKNGKNPFIPTRPGNRNQSLRGSVSTYHRLYREKKLSGEVQGIATKSGENRVISPRRSSVLVFLEQSWLHLLYQCPIQTAHPFTLKSDPVWNKLYVTLVISDLIKIYM